MKVIFKDLCRGEDYYLEINESQLKLFNWLYSHSALEDYELLEIKEDSWENIE